MRKRIFTFILAVLTALLPAAANAAVQHPVLLVSASEDIRLTTCEVVLPSIPAAGESPRPETYSVSPGEFETVRWIDMAEKREITSSDTFKEGHVCSFSAYIVEPAGYYWAQTTDGYPAVSVTCRTGDEIFEALSVMFNPNQDGSVTLIAVFTFTITAPETGAEQDPEDSQQSPSEPQDSPVSYVAYSGDSITSVTVRGAKFPVDGKSQQLTGFDASPCTVRDAGWYNVTDSKPLTLDDSFENGKDYCVSLFVIPEEGKKWAPDAAIRLQTVDGETVNPLRAIIQMGGDGVAVLVGDFILTALAEEPAPAPEPETPAPETGTTDPDATDPGTTDPGTTDPASESPETPPAEQNLSVTLEPSDLTVSRGGTAVFRAEAAGSGFSCRWIAVNGGTTIPLSDGAFGYGSDLSGTRTSTLTVKNIAPEMDGLFFACVFTAADGSPVSTRRALLTVSDGAAASPFIDVAKTDWFYSSVAAAVSYGLMNGRGGGLYEPYGTVTWAEAVKLAAVLRERAETGAVSLKNGDPWYSTYVDYAAGKGILTDAGTEGSVSKAYVLAHANEPITRSAFAWIFAHTLPAGTLPAINTIPDGTIPDVTEGGERYDAIYTLYRAGILNGSDERGTFRPDSNILRSEVAAIVVRMCTPGERVGAPSRLGE